MSASKCLWLTVVVLAIGCMPNTPVAKSNSAPPSMADAAGLAIPAATETPAAPASPAGSATPAAPASPAGSEIPAVPDANAQPPAQPTERVKAEAGVGIKGQSLEEHSGALVTPAKAFFRVEQRVVFDIQIPEAMKLFQATEGRLPNSEAEFMSKIIAANSINLPRLPQGHKYIYDVEAGELKVERPKKK